MASGSKTRNEFTKDNTGDGKSNGIVRSGKIMSAYPQDNVHGVDLPDTRGGSFGGSPTNLKHSLTGASAVQDGPGAARK